MKPRLTPTWALAGCYNGLSCVNPFRVQSCRRCLASVLLMLDKPSYDIHMVAEGMLQRGMIDVEASGSVGIGSAAHRSGQAIAAWRATGGSGTSAKGEPNFGRAVAADVGIRRATQPAWCTPHGSATPVGRE